MSPAKTVYIRDEDAPIWQRAEETAERTRQSVSQLVAGALRHYLPTIHTPDDEMESIRVKVGDRVTPLPDTVASPAGRPSIVKCTRASRALGPPL